MVLATPPSMRQLYTDDVRVCVRVSILCARVNVWSNCVIKTGEFEVQEETSGNLRRLRFNVSEVAQTTAEEMSLHHKSSQWQSWSWERNLRNSYLHKSLDLYTVDKKTYQTFGPEILDPWINQWRLRKARFRKTARMWSFLRHQPRTCENVIDWCCFYYLIRNSLVALLQALFDTSSALGRAFPGFLGNFFLLLKSLQERCFSTQEFTRFLSMVSSQRRTTRSDMSFQTK